MAEKNTHPHRESKKAPASVPVIPDLETLKMPRRNNAAAAKEIASGNRLWDRRHIAAAEARKALRRAMARDGRRDFRRLEKSVRIQMLGLAPSWSWANSTRGFYIDAGAITQFQVEEMAEAISTVFNDADPTLLRIDGLHPRQLDALRAVTHPRHRLMNV